MFQRRLDLWLPAYAAGTLSRALARRRRRTGLTHILFLVCDHFEPRHGIADQRQPAERLRAWRVGYARLQSRCRRDFGTSPVHTWFFPPHHGVEHLAAFSQMVFDGLGELELHYHHGGDTAETLRAGLQAAIAQYRRWGFLLEAGAPPRTAFGFVHGDWALDNAAGGRFCGVNGELRLLREAGCWGDFTMPSGNACQTRKINSIYYALGDPRRPKSHDRGIDARAGCSRQGELLLMQGPLGINWGVPGRPRIENGSLTSDNWGRPDRVRKWLDCNVHVKGRPEWLFVKLHAHGAIERDFDALFGEKAYEMHRVLNEQFNDGRRYRLHYVTARQAYNVARAAEDGSAGDPQAWVDHAIGVQPHTYYTVDAAHELAHCTPDRLVLRAIDGAGDGEVVLRSRVGALVEARGPLRAIEIQAASGTLRLEATPGAEVRVTLQAGWRIGAMDRGAALTVPGQPSWRLRVPGACEVRLVEDHAARFAGAAR